MHLGFMPGSVAIDVIFNLKSYKENIRKKEGFGLSICRFGANSVHAFDWVPRNVVLRVFSKLGVKVCFV